MDSPSSVSLEAALSQHTNPGQRAQCEPCSCRNEAQALYDRLRKVNLEVKRATFLLFLAESCSGKNCEMGLADHCRPSPASSPPKSEPGCDSEAEQPTPVRRLAFFFKAGSHYVALACLETHNLDQTGLRLTGIPASASGVLRLDKGHLPMNAHTCVFQAKTLQTQNKTL